MKIVISKSELKKMVIRYFDMDPTINSAIDVDIEVYDDILDGKFNPHEMVKILEDCQSFLPHDKIHAIKLFRDKTRTNSSQMTLLACKTVIEDIPFAIDHVQQYGCLPKQMVSSDRGTVDIKCNII